MRIVFFGSHEFAATILLSLLSENSHKIIAVFTQPPRPRGRSSTAIKTPVALIAEKHNIALYTPTSLKSDEIFEEFYALKPDCCIVAQYGLIIPERYIATPKLGMINIHASLLPAYRGASPVQAALLRGDKKTGISFMLIDKQLDHGPVLEQNKLTIEPNDTTETLSARLANLAGKKISTILNRYESGQISPIEQNHADATFARIIAASDGFIFWNQYDAKHIERMTRAFAGWPGVTTFFRGAPIKFMHVSVQSELSHKLPGTFFAVNKQLCVATLSHDLIINRLKPAGRSEQRGIDFINGLRLAEDLRFDDPATDVSSLIH